MIRATCAVAALGIGLVIGYFPLLTTRHRLWMGNGVAEKNTTLSCDLDGDGHVERVVLAPRRDPVLRVWRDDRLLWSGVPKKWKPWKLTTADVDGDGMRELLLGVHKSTRFFPTPHNCLFVYGWDGKRVFPKWLGSSLGRPFADFGCANVDDDEAAELIAVERTREGKRCLALYSWCGFGFEFDGERGPWEDLELLEGADKHLLVRADGRRVSIEKHTDRRTSS